MTFFDYLFYCYYRYCIRKDKFNAFFLSVFVARIDNQGVVYNTVEKSYRGCFENVKSCRFNVFNFV